MNIDTLGKVKEGILSRSILKNMDVVNVSSTKTAEGFDNIEYAYAGALNKAWVYAYEISKCNHKVVKPDMVSVAIILPVGVDEKVLKNITKLCDRLAKESGLKISGGNTIVSEAVKDVIVSFTVFCSGVNENDKIKKSSATKNKNDLFILMSAYTGIEGTAYMYEKYSDKVHDSLGDVLDSSFEKFKTWMNVSDHVDAILKTDCKNADDESDVYYIDALGTGGIYEGLYDLSKNFNCGFEVDLKKIPIRQETVEICNIMDVNPYMMRSAGSVLMVTDNPEKYIKGLEDEGIPVSIIGQLSNSNDKIVMIDDENKYVEPFKKDILIN